MKLVPSSLALSAAVLVICCGQATATVVGSGVFALSGTTLGTPTGLNFYLHSVGDQTGLILLPTLGVFSSLTPGSSQTIQDLTAAHGVVPGSTFLFANWIQLSDGINLNATYIPVPASIPVCSGTAFDVSGAQCRPSAASPVVLTQGSNGVSARLEVDGFAHFVGDSDYTAFVGLFNAPATRFSTISSLVTAYNTNGGIPDVSYTAQFTTVVPEPAWLAFAGLSLLGLSGLRRKFQK